MQDVSLLYAIHALAELQKAAIDIKFGESVFILDNRTQYVIRKNTEMHRTGGQFKIAKILSNLLDNRIQITDASALTPET